MTTENKQGAFLDSLTRNNSQIKRDRAEGIVEEAEVVYSSRIKKMEVDLNKMKRAQVNILDLNGDSAFSITPGKDFNSEDFVTADMDNLIQMETLTVKLRLAKERYSVLFGKEFNG